MRLIEFDPQTGRVAEGIREAEIDRSGLIDALKPPRGILLCTPDGPRLLPFDQAEPPETRDGRVIRAVLGTGCDAQTWRQDRNVRTHGVLFSPPIPQTEFLIGIPLGPGTSVRAPCDDLPGGKADDWAAVRSSGTPLPAGRGEQLAERGSPAYGLYFISHRGAGPTAHDQILRVTDGDRDWTMEVARRGTRGSHVVVRPFDTYLRRCERIAGMCHPTGAIL